MTTSPDEQQMTAKKALKARKDLQDSFFGDKLSRTNAIAAKHARDIGQRANPDEIPEEPVIEGVGDEPTQAELDAEAAALASEREIPDGSPGNQPPNDDHQDDDPLITRNGVAKKLSEWQAEIDDQFSRAADTAIRVRQQPEVELTDAELESMSDAIQTGGKDEAKKALRTLANKAAQSARAVADAESVKNDAIARMRGVIETNKDLANDPALWTMTQGFESQLVKKVFDAHSVARDAELRLGEAFKMTRAWFERTTGKQKGQNELERREKAAKAAAATSGGSTSRGKNNSGGAPVLSERASQASAVEAERKRRAAMRG